MEQAAARCQGAASSSTSWYCDRYPQLDLLVTSGDPAGRPAGRWDLLRRIARVSARFVAGGQRLADVPEVLCASPDSLAAHGTLHDPCWPAGRSCWRRGGGQICRWRCIRSPGIWRLECARSWIARRAFRGAV